MFSGLPETYDAFTMTLASLDDKFTSVEIRKALSMEHDRRMSKCEDEQTKNEIAAYQKKGKQNAHNKSTKSVKVSVAENKDILQSNVDIKRKKMI